MAKALKKLFVAFFIILFFSSFSPAFDFGSFNLHKVKVLDQNMYLGADLTPLFEDPTLVPYVLAEIIASNYPARAEAFARAIKLLKPDVICLQEAEVFQILETEPDSGPVPLLLLDWDFKQLLLHFLGGDYYEVVTNQLFEISMPIDESGTRFARIQDQDVILARKNVIQTGTPETIIFDALLPLTLPLPGGPVDIFIPRGLSTARLTIRGQQYIIGNTHLESFDARVRRAQAEEVVDAFEGERGPIILAGDFNSNPGWPAYNIIRAEFNDAWPRRLIGRRDPGCTYGRDDLISDDAVFDERIDFVFTRNRRVITLAGFTIGKSEFSKTFPVPYPTEPPSLVRLWPSDHLGLFFALIFSH